ncbi:MAG: 6-carboxytetrahydropterin synthase [Myxococcales bacterium]|nr:6-carboxytetrahydropterin synthase [Myxococcales bacterium]MDD9964797.1 6-carboxytetrahydropterin synthase [Myxococcales bacterium]
MFVIHRSIDVDFAHHVRGHAGGCINVHGHTWKFEVGLRAHHLDERGFVTDFGDLQRRVLDPIHDLLDHSLALGRQTYEEAEPALCELGQRLLSSRSECSPVAATPITLAGAETRFPGGMKVAVFPFAPTSERLAQWLHQLATGELADGRVGVAYGRIYETLHPVESIAEYRGPDPG